MGSSYSDLNLYFKRKKDDNKEPNEKGPKNGGTDNKNQIFSVKVSKSNYDKCVNFEKVTHTITFTPPNKGTNYNIILCEGDENKKGKSVFGYYYPSNDKEVLSQLHVYYSVLAPNDPLVVSFFTVGEQTYNFLYSGLISTRWVRAYTIAYYSLGQDVSSELLTKEFRKSHRNRKIQFVTGTNVKDVSGFKQELEKNNVYRYIYYPSGNASVLGSESLCKFDSENPEPLVCPENNKSSEAANPSSSSEASTPAQTNSKTKYNNKIDPYYLDLVKGHHYDGVILYFVINGNQEKPNGKNQAVNNGGAGSSPQGNSGTSNASGQGNSEKYDKNMAVLLELIVNCKPKTHFKREDKLGNWWTQEQVKYNDDKDLIKELQEIKKSADSKETTTFILENKNLYKGVSEVKKDEQSRITYTKYTHSATTTNKTNLLFRKGVTKINNFETSDFKTQTLDVYFLKTEGNEQDWPFIFMFTIQNDKAGAAAPAGANEQQQPPQQQQPQQQQPPPATAGSASTGPKPCKKCYFSKGNYTFDDWEELKNDENPGPEEKTKEKNGKQEDQGEKLEKKLKERLDKIEQFGKCTNDINILRSIAYQVLIGVKEPDTSKAAKPEPPEGRPEIKLYTGDIGGTSLKVVLGSVAAGLVVLGIISAIIYGIYWYNTTIKLLT